MSPKISILCPSHNHEKFIGYFINSVLNQSEQDFELIIVDDCSSDANLQEIEKFSDPRIKVIKRKYNQGINAGLNDAFNVSSGEYCVFIASDDILNTNHLELTSKYLEENKNIDVFYCSLTPIDDSNQIIQKNNWIQNDIARFELLRRMFLEGNVLSSPGMVIRRDALARIMPLDLSMLQYQDYQIHVNLLLRGDVYISTQPLVQYRQISGKKNISAVSFATCKRIELEESKLMDSFLQVKDIDLLTKIFGEKLNEFGKPTKETIPYFLGRLALCSKDEEKQKWGYRIIMDTLKNKQVMDLLNSLYGFSFYEYINLVNKFTINKAEKKYRKYKILFNIALLLMTFPIMLLIGFLIKFKLS